MNEGGVLQGLQKQLCLDRQGWRTPRLLVPVVGSICNRIEVLLALARQIGALGLVLTHQAVHVFVGAPLS